jgi:hypothetical protein
MTRTAAIVLAAVLAQYPAPRQPEARPAVVIGQVLDAATGRGVRQTVVRLAGAGVTHTRVADERGRFYFRGLPAGSFTITAMRDGYFDGAFGRVRAGGDALELPLAAGQWKADVEIALFRPATITGVVDDEAAEPLAGIRVQAFRRAWSGGREQWVPGESSTTDDQGLYRLHGLMPGEYVVAVPSIQVTMPIATMEGVGQTGRSTRDIMAVLFMNGGPGSLIGGTMDGMSAILFDPDDRNTRVPGATATPPEPDGGRRLAYPTVFYPAADAPEAAATVEVGPGETRAGVSFRLRPVPTVRVSGRLEGPDGPVPGLMLRLVRDGATDFGVGAETAATLSAPDGSFTLLDVPAGGYVLSARAAFAALPNWRQGGVAGLPERRVAGTLAGVEELWGELPVSVYDEDISDLVVTVASGVTMSGRVAFDTQGDPPDTGLAASVVLTLEGADGGAADLPPAPVTKEGAFTIAGIRPGRYLVRADVTPQGWHLTSATWGGQDATREPLDLRAGNDVEDVVVTLTDRPARISGGVYDDRGLVVSGARVIVVPAGPGPGVDPHAPPGRIRSVRASLYGVYELTGLQPGAYDLLAADEEAGVRWQDPAALARLPGPAVRVTVAAGQTVQQSLVVRSTERRASARQTWPAEAGRSCRSCDERAPAAPGPGRASRCFCGGTGPGRISLPAAGVNRGGALRVE